MNLKRILISGAGIAGPALALCLRDSGCHVTLVERARSLRDGGQAVDFRGPVHRAILERLDLWRAIQTRRTEPGPLELIDAGGTCIASLPEVMFAGDVEILRGDLCRLLYERSSAFTDYRFGSYIESFEDRGESVVVKFADGARDSFDLVVGADGLHSRTRALGIAAESDVLRHHGYRLATFGLRNLLDRTRGGVSYAEPGRSVYVQANSPERARALLLYAVDGSAPAVSEPERLLADIRRRFAGMGWRTAEVLEAVAEAQDLYADSIATVHVSRYSRGRVALLGDAAWGGTLGGQGTSLAIVGAYVLANELALASAPAQAFAAYERLMRPYASGCQVGARRVGGFFAPRSSVTLAARNLMYRALTTPALSKFFERLVKSAASDFELPHYGERNCQQVA